MKKKKTLKLAIIFSIIAILIIIVCVSIIFLGKKQIDSYKTQITDLQYELDSNTITVYVASRDIKAGEPIYADKNVDGTNVTSDKVNVYMQEIRNGLPEDFFISDEQLGCQAKIDITESEPVMRSCVTQTTISTDDREYEIAVAELMTDQTEYDFVDVRILFPDGSDYIVLAKKPVKNLHLDTNVFTTYCNEDEIVRFSSAIIDAFTTTGAKIYTTRYVESSLQAEAIPYYPVRSATLTIIQNDPNILKVAEETLNAEARNSLALRLSLLSKDQLDAVSKGFGIEDTARSQIFADRIEEQKAESEGTEATDYGIGETITEEEVTDGGLADVVN